MAKVRIVGELVQVRILRSVSGYGRRGDLVEVSLDVAAGLMENRLAEYLGVTSFVVEASFVGETEADGGVSGEVEPGGGKSARKRRSAPRGGGGDPVDAEQGEGSDAG